MNKIQRPRRHALAASLCAALLSACGGSADGRDDDGLSTETAQSASANGVLLVDGSARAHVGLLAAARGVIAVSGVSGAPGCAGGGYAVFTATAGSSGSLTNGVPDPGEAYSIEFVNCRSSAGGDTLLGTLNLTVLSESGENHAIATTANVWVTQPDRTVRLTGSSTLTHSVQSAGSTRIETDRWVSPSSGVRSVRHNRTTAFTLTNVDLTQSVTTTDGVVVARNSQGTVTINYDGWVGRWSATVATDGLVSFSANGLPLTGRWLVTLPHDLVVLTIAGTAVTAALDFGRNGVVERTLLWPITVLLDAAD